MSRLLLSLALVCSSSAALGQARPIPGIGDPHLQSIDYRADQVTLVEAAPGYQVTIVLAPDEQVTNVALGDSASWQAVANRAGDRLFVKLLQPGGATNMTVITNAREYAFELSPLAAPSPDMAYSIRFRYPAAAVAVAPTSAANIQGLYRVHGVKALRPSGIEDDGVRTYIQWPDEVALPAIYALDKAGREILVNGNMRDGAYVIDSVPGRLLFRIDAQTARAERVLQKTRP